MGAAAANQPFQQPAQPVAGFTPDQLMGQKRIRDIQGFAQPYMDTGADYLNKSATPITGDETANYFNPFANYVGANLAETFGQQNRDFTGKLTQTAGGVGADRIAVGQGELSRQQGLATGNVFADLYQKSLAAAQADKMRQANAGFGFPVIGGAAQQAQLTGAGALLGTGGQQQQLEQAKQMSPFQQELARIAYPFQTSQFLSGVTSQMAPGMGGTSTKQEPAPSIWSQILGAGTTAASIYGGMGGKGSSGYNPYSSVSSAMGSGATGATFAEGGQVEQEDELFGGTSQLGVPEIHSPPQPMRYPSLPSGGSGGGSGGGSKGGESDTSKYVKMGLDAAKLAMMFLERGGAVHPHSMYKGYEEGGGVEEQPFPNLMDPTSQPNLGQYPFLAQNMPSIVPQLAAQRAQAPQPTQIPPQGITPPVAPPQAQGAEYGSSPYPMASQSDIEVPPEGNRAQQFARSPWLALTAAGLGTMGGTSPYAGVNIGKGGLEGVKVLEQQRKQEGQ
mgnify:CR=1 FL=1